jgi:hypothetical protein
MSDMKLILEGWRQYLDEELYYQNDPKDPEDLEGPLDRDKTIARLIDYFKIRFPELYSKADLSFKSGKTTLHFTNFGDLKDRDMAIRTLRKDGVLLDADDAKDVKRLDQYHRAKTKFVDVRDNGKRVPIVIQLNSGKGGATAGLGYEKDFVAYVNEKFEEQELPYKAKDLPQYKGNSKKLNPDVVVKRDGEKYISFELKTSAGADFGQFQVATPDFDEDGLWIGDIDHKDIDHPKTEGSNRDVEMISQIGSKTLVKAFNKVYPALIKNEECMIKLRNLAGLQAADTEDSEAAYRELVDSADLARVPVEDIGQLTTAYYLEKGVDFLVINDMLYAMSPLAQEMNIPGVKTLVEAATSGIVRARIKCHGKTYSATGALKITKIEDSVKFNEPDIFNALFP